MIGLVILRLKTSTPFLIVRRILTRITTAIGDGTIAESKTIPQNRPTSKHHKL